MSICIETEDKKELYMQEALRLEAVTVCVGFDDLLDYSLSLNHGHFDHYIVVTSHDDKKTHMVAAHHGVTCVPTDLFTKNERVFNKGAAINAGFNYFQYHGWRLHIDSDIVLPNKFRQILFNHSHLEQDCLYGADRVDIEGNDIPSLRDHIHDVPQHRLRFLVDPSHDRRLNAVLGGRMVTTLEGYTPLGFFQLWHASCQKRYPYSIGTAAHDDTMFSQLWPVSKRRLLPSVVCYHICPQGSGWGKNWEGRKSERLK